MKKFFFSLLALVSVSMMSVSLVSCGNDEDEPTPQDQNIKYHLEFVVSNDILDIYDVDITKIVGDQKTTYPLKQDKEVSDILGKWKGKSTGADEFEVAKSTSVSVNSTFKLKSTWRENISGRTQLTLRVIRTAYSNGSASSGSEAQGLVLETEEGETFQFDEDYLTELAESFQSTMQYNNK